MSQCSRVHHQIPALLSDELAGRKKERILDHLRDCPACREEYDAVADLFKKTEILAPEFNQVVQEIDWDDVSEKIAARTISVGPREQIQKSRTPRQFFSPRLKPLMAGLAAGLILGSVLTFIYFYSIRSRDLGPEFVVSQGFLENAELAMARRDTVDYLDRSRFLLLEFVQAPDESAPEYWAGKFSAEKTRFLMAKKKYINPQLEKFRMAKAKALCDQIELLFFELANMSEEFSVEEIRTIQQYIEEKQLLLKIKLVKQELEFSEARNEI